MRSLCPLCVSVQTEGLYSGVQTYCRLHACRPVPAPGVPVRHSARQTARATAPRRQDSRRYARCSRAAIRRQTSQSTPAAPSRSRSARHSPRQPTTRRRGRPQPTRRHGEKPAPDRSSYGCAGFTSLVAGAAGNCMGSAGMMAACRRTGASSPGACGAMYSAPGRIDSSLNSFRVTQQQASNDQKIPIWERFVKLSVPLEREGHCRA
jgi:hypothetical protein